MDKNATNIRTTDVKSKPKWALTCLLLHNWTFPVEMTFFLRLLVSTVIVRQNNRVRALNILDATYVT